MKINFIKLLYEEENNMKKNKGITLSANRANFLLSRGAKATTRNTEAIR